jgi:hypothetical protein
MKLRIALPSTFAAILAIAAFMPAAPAAALTMKECSVKYKAAQADGSAKDMKWNDFRKAQCGADAEAEPDVSLNSDEDAEPEVSKVKAPTGVKFPKAIASKYASEKPGKARMHTCVDAYHENKKNNSLGGLKWIQKGGGYYSLCNAKLKS